MKESSVIATRTALKDTLAELQKAPRQPTVSISLLEKPFSVAKARGSEGNRAPAASPVP